MAAALFRAQPPLHAPHVRTRTKAGWTCRMLPIAALHVDLRVSASLPACSPALLVALQPLVAPLLAPALLPVLPVPKSRLSHASVTQTAV